MYHQQPVSISLVTPTYHNHSSVLEVTVIGCHKLEDTEWISRQDPYVCLEYGNTRNRTRVCTDGGKNPTFQEKFVYNVVEGLRELNMNVWNSNTISRDDFIGSGKVHLGKVLSQGYDDSSWPLHTKHGRHGGEVRLIMHYSGANAITNYHHVTPQVPSMYYAPPQPPSSMAYPPDAATGAYHMPSSIYPPQLATNYPPQPYPPNSVYPPQPYGSHYTHGSPYPGYSL
ncbi:elicitor-responsive protein 3-like [Bidens hawaiensis]|uniref:elicitor-responsive protein 3-like n=1 Tax=Bidens hawaiensis TaxID=980011 RepID=UPI0040492AE5